jgi:hypothetical protein
VVAVFKKIRLSFIVLISILILSPTVAISLSGQGTSNIATLDSRPPVVAITYPSGGEIFTGGEVEELAWTIDEDWFNFDPLPITLTVLDGEVVLWTEEIAPDPSGNYLYGWTVVDETVIDAVIVVSATDHFGLNGSVTSEPFAIQGSGTSVDPEIPLANLLEPNFPNPFNPSTTLQFSLREAAHIALSVYDLHGREIANIAGGEWAPGVHTVPWNGIDFNGHCVASGVYFARLSIQEENCSEIIVQRMMLLK